MTQEIKIRIEQIKRGEVPEGYKRTKVGIVPEEWEETRFKKMFSRLTRKNNEGNTNVLTISAQYGLINQEEFFKKSVASEEKSNYYLLHKGEFAYNKSYSNGYPFGAIKQLVKYEKGVVSPLYICFVKSDENLCPEFFVHYFEAGMMNREIQAFAQEGARNHGLLNIFVDDFFNSNIILPPLAEQQKIAEILTCQDKKIQFYQKKIEELKKLKKAYLSKMFPKKGSNVPELRFEGFTEPWEQRKFDDILQTLPFKAYLKSPEQDGKYEIIQQGNDPIIGYANGEPCKDYENTVIFGDHTLSLYKPKNPFFVATDGVRIVKGFDNMDGNYLFPLLERNKPQSEGYKRYYSILTDIDVFFTGNHEEQSKIGKYFSELDNLITLHQLKLEELQKNKKALMQLLLTGIVRVKN